MIGGDTSGSVTEDAAATLSSSGTLSVTDADTGEAVFVAQTAVAGSNGHGTFTLGTDGAWSYAADNTQSAIQALANGETLTDSFTAVTADGTTQLVTVTITGVDDGAVIGGDTTGKTKPDPAPLFAATDRIGIAPRECIYVGDDRRDVQAGQAAGMKTIVVKFGYLHGNDPETWAADAMIDTPQELLQHL